ncbi:CBS domain-containing protein [Candidatus Woesearchaeota archaeon]|nr:MAG: CBS domain-containing protein [Candidatus Woesearchaeota archaeon]
MSITAFFKQYLLRKQQRKLYLALQDILQTNLGNLLSQDPQEILPTAPLNIALKRMIERGNSFLLVLDKNKPLGILREKAFLEERAFNKNFLNLPVKSCMEPVPPILANEATLHEAMESAVQHQHTETLVRLPNNNLGVVSLQAIAERIDRHYNDLIENIDILPKVKDFTFAPAIWVDYDTPLLQARRLLLTSPSGSLLVRPPDDFILKGIITERDFISEFYKYGAEFSRFLCKNIMNSPVVTIRPETDIFEANRVMLKQGFRRLPVTETNRYLGIITPLQLFDCLIKTYHQFTRKQITSQARPQGKQKPGKEAKKNKAPRKPSREKTNAKNS